MYIIYVEILYQLEYFDHKFSNYENVFFFFFLRFY